MKVKNGFVAVKANKVKYDPEFAEDGKRLPKTLTVEANKDYLECLTGDDCFFDEPGMFDEDETTEYLGELIEERTGVPVVSFEWQFK